jgi:hypothetical protein
LFNAAYYRVKQKSAYVALTNHPDPQAHDRVLKSGNNIYIKLPACCRIPFSLCLHKPAAFQVHEVLSLDLSVFRI